MIMLHENNMQINMKENIVKYSIDKNKKITYKRLPDSTPDENTGIIKERFFIEIERPINKASELKVASRDMMVMEIYTTICDFCVRKKNTTPPPFNRFLLEKLYDYKYKYSQKNLRLLDFDTEGKKTYATYSLEYHLKKLCNSLPDKIESLRYFLKVLLPEEYYNR